MVLGKIVGTVVSTQKDEKLEGLKFYVVKEIDLSLQFTGKHVIAVDTVGAGEDEIVLYASGSSARQTSHTEGKPVDATIMGIVDNINVEGKTVYSKAGIGR